MNADLAAHAVFGAIEGPTDEAVAIRLLKEVGAVNEPLQVKNGKGNLFKRINGFNNAARFVPWFILIDLDHDEPCPSALRDKWLPNRAPHMCFRIAVRAVEAWLIADRDRIASFLKISPASVPRDVEALDDSKRALVNLARRSRSRAIREDMVPRQNSGREVGPAYTSRVIDFVADPNGWRPKVAAESSRSLQRCLDSLRILIREFKNK